MVKTPKPAAPDENRDDHYPMLPEPPLSVIATGQQRRQLGGLIVCHHSGVSQNLSLPGTRQRRNY